MTHTPQTLASLLDEHGLEPSRALGQNFVVDPNTVRRIARLAEVGPGDRVVEIGAGLGSLTLALVETGAEIVAIERDRHLVPVLRDIVEPHDVTVIEADAMEFDWSSLGPEPHVLVANLPYNVATPLVLDLLRDAPNIERILVMVQREAAERLAAPPGSRIYGIPSVKAAFHADASIVGRVPASVFIPKPKVESALIRLDRRPSPAGVDRDRLFSLVEAGFGQRRKMLRRALAGHVTAEDFAAADVDPTSRAEALDLAAWVRLASVPRTL